MTDDDITLTADEWTVHAREKTSTGQYENIEHHATLSGTIPGDTTLDEDARRELKARLLALQKDAQRVVGRACENRVRECEDWGVYDE